MLISQSRYDFQRPETVMKFMRLWDAFVHKLQCLFQIDITSLTNDELGAIRLAQMGIDSLTTVEIRGWLMNTCEVNIPVLKILNCISVGGLVDTAREIITIQLAPDLTRCSPEEASSELSIPSQDVLNSSDRVTNTPFDSDLMNSSNSKFSSDPST